MLSDFTVNTYAAVTKVWPFQHRFWRKLTNNQWHYLCTSYIEFKIRGIWNMENTATNVFTPVRNVCLLLRRYVLTRCYSHRYILFTFYLHSTYILLTFYLHSTYIPCPEYCAKRAKNVGNGTAFYLHSWVKYACHRTDCHEISSCLAALDVNL
jgi:hypothetical protein